MPSPLSSSTVDDDVDQSMAAEQSQRQQVQKHENDEDESGGLSQSGQPDGIKRQKSSAAELDDDEPDQNPSSNSDRGSTPPRPTTSSGRMSFPQVAASPPRFVAIEEIMKAAKGVSNMYLAHEIAVDEEFRLEKVKAANESGLRQQVEDVMKKAFWDILEGQLNDTPPKYKQALVLLTEIKEDLMSLLLPQHTKLKQEIQEILDIDLIKQQAENGALDFARYSQYVLSVTARLCAPVRDEKIRELTQTSDVVALFKGIMDLLELMKLDMANFTIAQMRPHIQQQSVEYERKKFKEFLESQSKFACGVDGLEYTRKWLKRNYLSMDLSNESQQQVINKVLSGAYIELLVWDDTKQDFYPETLLMDQSRFEKLRDTTTLLTLLGSILLVTFATAGAAVQQLTTLNEFKLTLKRHLMLIMSDGGGDSPNEAAATKPEPEKLEAAALQVQKELQTCLAENNLPALDAAKESSLRTQIKDLANQDNRVRLIIQRRVLEFVEGVSASNTASPIQIPSGLSVLQEELTELTGSFIRIVTHNRAVFIDYYTDCINSINGLSSSTQGN